MAEEGQGQVLSTAFPAPPPFYKHFTAENLKRVKEAKSTAKPNKSEGSENNGNDESSTSGILSLPPELRYMIPPEPPANGKYTLFGRPYDINETLGSLEDAGVEQLFPSQPDDTAEGGSDVHAEWTFDRAVYLKRMARSILMNFLELVGLLAIDPEAAVKKLEDFRVLFVNAHHLINEYRPHQARETLILLLEKQLKMMKDETEGISRMRVQIDDMLEKFSKDDVEPLDETYLPQKKVSPQTIRQRREKAIWQALNEEMSL
ncbi:MED7-domain-containing protein [Patellaria atrata CBS 101060]|uniref:Mediator of RNA polymerase II transcription subunit 7 n=1 Tax=Patellaria atrata CBS 101060 TaxID=1346257 RepID=A0A9P4S7C7_9PEZI|nr:MED7-domain-containing protein [Patellaria atrata CBS 101060]